MKEALVLHVSDIGDIICGSIVIDALVEKGYHVDFLIPPSVQTLFKQDPRVRTLHSAQELPHKQYDLIIDLTSDQQSRHLVRRLRGKVKIGRVKNPWQRLRHWVSYHRMVDKVYNQHIVGDYYPVLEYLGAKTPRDPCWPLAQLPTEKVIAIHFGAHNAKRVMPPKLIAPAIKFLHQQGFSVELLGTEHELAQEILEASDQLARYQPRTLAQVKELLRSVRLFIGTDSGLLHLAASLGTPSIGVYGPNVPRRSGPPQKHVSFLQKELPCRPCNQNLPCPIQVECMNSLSGQELITHIQGRLAQ